MISRPLVFILLGILAAGVLVALGVLPERGPSAASHAPRVGLTYAYVAPPSEFCLGGSTQQIIQTDGSYESNLVGGSTRYPIPDTDYMQPSGYQGHVCLPGNKYDHYYFLGSSFVQGSGCVQEYQADNGGRFALLHMDCGYSSVAPPDFFAAPSPATPGPIYTFLQGSRLLRDNTYNGIPSGGVKGVIQIYPGGHYVGRSRWPTSYQYSFGSCYDDSSCQTDAHLCVVADALALEWFQRVQNGQDHHAPPFHLSLWNAYRSGHRLHLISPYVRGTHRLLTIAAFWSHHTGLHGITRAVQAFKGFHKGSFRYGVIYCFPNTRCKTARR